MNKFFKDHLSHCSVKALNDLLEGNSSLSRDEFEALIIECLLRLMIDYEAKKDSENY